MCRESYENSECEEGQKAKAHESKSFHTFILSASETASTGIFLALGRNEKALPIPRERLLV